MSRAIASLVAPEAVTAGPRALIVDVNQRDRLSMRNALVSAGWEVDLAAGPSEAIRLALRQRPDVVLIDISSVAYDPVDAVVGLRCEHGVDLPILAASTGDDWQSAQNLGVQRLLRKPFRMDRLVDNLATAAGVTGPREYR